MNFEREINKYCLNSVSLPNTEKYSAILGLNPSKGARSPKLWNKAYSYLKISAEMIPIDIPEKNFEKLLFILKNDPNFSGGAVAAPYKELAAKCIVHNLTKEAKSIGAINCLFRNNDGELCGTNTDGEGALVAFQREFGTIENKKILILGIGGTGKAVSAYFSESVLSPKQLYLSSRSDSAAHFSKKIGCQWKEWDSIIELIPNMDIVVNCTSLGSTLFPGEKPIHFRKLNNLKKDLIVYDVIYDPNSTPLIDDVNSIGLTTFNGSAMNFEQAVIGFSYSVTSGVKDIDLKKIITAMKS